MREVRGRPGRERGVRLDLKGPQDTRRIGKAFFAPLLAACS